MEANRGTNKVVDVIKALVKMLNSPELESLRRVFYVWTNGLLQRHAPDEIAEKLAGVDIFKEFEMLEAVYENWGDTCRKEGELKILIRQLSRRFGQLPKWAESRISKAEPAQLENWADAVLDASNLTEILGTPDNQ